MTRLAALVAGVVASVLAVVVGVFLVAGLGAALIVGGVTVAGSCLFLFDVDERAAP